MKKYGKNVIIASKERKNNMVIACYAASMLRPKAVDEFFKGESEAFDDVIVYSLAEDSLATRLVNIDGAEVFYRGWILSPAEYGHLGELLASRSASLAVSPGEYERAQFAGWLPAFDGLTPDTAALSGDPELSELQRAADVLGYPLVIKGFSKSAKEYWNDAMFVENSGDFSRVFENFRKYVSPEEDGGVLLRSFENLAPGERRCWFARGGELVEIGNHPTAPLGEDFAGLGEFLGEVSQRLAEAKLDYVAVDVTRNLDNDSWRVVEVGSAMVSECAEDFGPRYFAG